VTISQTAAEKLAADLMAAFAEVPQVIAVALGGSTVTGAQDAGSDIDLYVYVADAVPVAFRAALAARGGGRAEIDNRVWETGDEWDDAATGVHVDLMYRTPAWAGDELSRVLDRHEPRLGYSTCVWYNILTSRAMFDREGWFAELQARAHQPYPEPLARSIVAKNQPVLRSMFGAYRGQIEKAMSRGDAVSVNHRVAAFLASYFDVVFAVNRTPHPGEKRLLVATHSLPNVPNELARNLDRLLASSGQSSIVPAVDALCDGLDTVCARLGYEIA
jgi:hypothetical protein